LEIRLPQGDSIPTGTLAYIQVVGVKRRQNLALGLLLRSNASDPLGEGRYAVTGATHAIVAAARKHSLINKATLLVGDIKGTKVKKPMFRDGVCEMVRPPIFHTFRTLFAPHSFLHTLALFVFRTLAYANSEPLRL